MRNWKKAVMTAVVAAAFLTSCGTRQKEEVTSGEIVVPQMSSEDLLVTSLEYLLEEDHPGAQIENDGTKRTEEEEIQPKDAQWQEEDADAKSEQAVIYYGKGDFTELLQETIQVDAIEPDELIDALARHNIVPLLDTKVLSFEIQEEDGARAIYLDLSKAFGEYLRTMSKEAECIIVASVTNTFLENYGADALYLTVEGEAVITMNAEYRDALRKCTPEELM